MVLSCVIQPRNPSPFGLYLRHNCQHLVNVLFMLTKNEFSAEKDEDKERISVSGDPSSHAVNVTISQLKVSDTGCYFCEFLVENPSSEDLKLPGERYFFLNVRDGEFPLSRTLLNCLKPTEGENKLLLRTEVNEVRNIYICGGWVWCPYITLIIPVILYKRL